MRKVYCLILLVIFQVFPKDIFAQENPPILTDSTSFQDFLILQKEVQGLSVRFKIAKSDLTDTIPGDSILHFFETSPGEFSSLELFQFTELPSLLQSLKPLDPRWEFLIFSQPSTFAATQEYVSNLIRNGDIQVSAQDIILEKDLVLLASNFHYVPFFKHKLPFFSDVKLVIVTIIIAFFLITALLMMIFTLLFKSKRTRNEAKIKEYEPIIAEKLTSLLFEKELEEIRNLSDEEINSFFPSGLLKTKIFQDVLIHKIIGLNKKMKGDFKVKLKALYQKFGLDKVTYKNIQSKQWDSVASGLVQINEMDLIEALPEVKKFANSSNFHVRTQAVGTLLNLSETMDLTFLKNQKYPLSSWQQMNYLRIIKFLYPQKELQMLSLFDSENLSVRLFGYKLVRLIGRFDLLGNLEKNAPNASDEEKIEIIKTYESLGAHMQADFVNSCLESENPDLQEAAIQAVGVIGNENSISILEKLLKSQPEFPLKKVLLKSLQSLDTKRFEAFTDTQSDFDTRRLKLHLSDPLLRHV